MIAFNMIGNAGGGIVAILMQDIGLFVPLFVGAGMSALATALVLFLVYEPSHYFKLLEEQQQDASNGPETQARKTTDEEIVAPPEKLDNRVMVTIVLGAIMDNLGSAGLTYISLAPLAFNAFYQDYEALGRTPIMSASAFKWIQTMLAFAVVLGAVGAPYVFQRIGPACGCVSANVATALIIAALLGIAEGLAPSSATFAIFVTVLYAGFPFAVISQLSTGPMLDAIAPADKRGYVQGLNMMSLNAASALSPYLLGELAGKAGTAACMWTTVGLSLLAAAVNLPLLFVKRLQQPPKAVPPYWKTMDWEDEEAIQKALKGEWIPASALNKMDEDRIRKGLPMIRIPYGTYEADKPRIGQFQLQAKDDFEHHQRQLYSTLREHLSTDEDIAETIQLYNQARAPLDERR